jgi:acyl-CoA hydrolase
MNLQPKKSSESVCSTTEFVLPSHTNAFGNVFGGTIMGWVDLCAAIAAQRHAGNTTVTAFVDDLKFEAPVSVGEVVRLESRVTATFRTSLEVEVIVRGEDTTTGRSWPCVTAFLTFVAIDKSRKPTPVPPLVMETEEDRRRQREGEERRARRLGKTPPTAS